MVDVLAIVPARAGSKGIPFKNRALCAGKSLIHWTYEAIKQSKLVTAALLTTDDHELLNDTPHWLKLIDRPSHLAADDTPLEPVIEHALSYWLPKPEVIVLLQPTSPIRIGAQIDEAIELLMTSHADSLVSVSPNHALLWSEEYTGEPLPLYDIFNRPRRQDLRQWADNGSIYAFTYKHWERHHNRLGGKVVLYKMPEECGCQVDTPLDLFIVEQILTRRQVWSMEQP